MNTFQTKYGLVTLYHNEYYIGNEFKGGKYWDEDTLLKLRTFVDPDRNILEIGGHCGTSSIVYSSFLNENKKVYVFEPQENMFRLLCHNISQNGLENKIEPYHAGVFCYSGQGKMNGVDMDGPLPGLVEKRYNEEKDLACNFGGVGLGSDGEIIHLTTMDEMPFDNIGYIHCDAQGAENFIFSKGLSLIEKHRPVIYYENNQNYAKYLYDNVCSSYPQYKLESIFDIKKYCLDTLNYSGYIDKFNGGIDTLLVP